MKRALVLLVIAGLVAVVIAGCGTKPVQSGRPSVHATTVAQGLGATSPAISGDTVVWMEHPRGDWDIYGCDLTTGHQFPVCTRSGDQVQPAVSGDVVVWTDGWKGAATPPAPSGANSCPPA